MSFSGVNAGDTALDSPLFYPDDEHKRLVDELIETKHERDALHDDVQRLEKELSRMRDATRSAEPPRGRASAASQELALGREIQSLREQISKRESELNRFREGHQTLEKLLAEARTKLQTLKTEKVHLDREIVVRDRAIADIDRRFSALEREAAGLRSSRAANDETVMGLRASQAAADAELQSLRTGREELSNALTKVEARVQELQRTHAEHVASMTLANAERMREVQLERGAELAETENRHAQERLELAESFGRLEREYEQLQSTIPRRIREREEILESAMAELVACSEKLAAERDAAHAEAMELQRTDHARALDGLRLEHAMTYADMERGFSQVRAALLNAVACSEGARAGWEVRCALEVDEERRRASEALAVLRDEHTHEIAERAIAHASEIDTMFTELSTANADLARSLASAQQAHDLERLAASAAHDAELQFVRDGLMRDLATRVAEHALELSRMQSTHEATLASEIATQADAIMEAEQRRVSELEAALAQLAHARSEAVAERDRACEARAEIALLRERWEQESVALLAMSDERLELARRAAERAIDDARAEERFEASLQARDADEARIRACDELRAEVAKAQRAIAETRAEAEANRVKLVRQLSEAHARLAGRTEQEQREHALAVSEARRLAGVVGQLTSELLGQAALCSALRRKRARPEAFDVDEALSFANDVLPDEVAQNLWSNRDALVERFTNDARLVEDGRG